MTHEEFKNMRIALKYGMNDLSAALDTPVRTLRDWEAGKNKIPGVVSVAMGLLLERAEGFDRVLKARIEASLDRKFPAGIPSDNHDEE